MIIKGVHLSFPQGRDQCGCGSWLVGFVTVACFGQERDGGGCEEQGAKVSICLSHRSQQTISNPGVVNMEDLHQQPPRL